MPCDVEGAKNLPSPSNWNTRIPWRYLDEPAIQINKNSILNFKTGSLTRLKDRDTDWPIGCSESESKSGLTSEYPMRKGGPVASLKVVEYKQRGGIHINWSRQQTNSLLRFCLQMRRKTVHTACLRNPQCSDK